MGRRRQDMPEVVAVETLQHPPLVGQRYLVRAVQRCCDDGVVRCFPVTGPLHADPEIAVPDGHLHYDLRFLPPESARHLALDSDREEVRGLRAAAAERGRSLEALLSDQLAVKICAHLLLLPRAREQVERLALPCLRLQPTIDARAAGPWLRTLESRYAGACITPEGTCPHKGLPLRSQPIRGGVRTCPGHQLCFDRRGALVRRSEAALREGERLHDALEQLLRGGRP